MSYQVCFTEKFKGYLKKMMKDGGESQNAARRAQQALSEAQMFGEIKCVPRTFHGEDRLPNVEKYHLTDTYRLVVQLIDGVNKVRVFLFAGIHEEADLWLDNNRGYRYVIDGKDSVVRPVLITEKDTVGTRGFDLESTEEEMQLPLLRDLNESEINGLVETEECRQFIAQCTSEDWENRSATILDEVVAMFPNNEALADTILNLFEIAHDNRFDKLQQMRLVIAKYHAQAKVVDGPELAEALRNPVNAECFIEYETDMGDFWAEHPDADWDDWMLFLNPKQKEWAKKELNGPARLCGVSGSGKTSVMLHRARFLAKKHPREPIAILTLTLSMKNLLDSLLNRLCGTERAFIETYTVEGFIKNSLVEKVHPQGLRWVTRSEKIDSRYCRDYVAKAVKTVFESSEFNRAPWNTFDDKQKTRFIIEEISFVRTRLTPDKYDDYCSAEFKRVGREIPMQENLRRIMLKAIRDYEADIARVHWADHETMSHAAVQYINNEGYKKYRAVMIDEVQDLSQNDLRAIGLMKNIEDVPLMNAPNSLFLVGDGAQTIYKNGFSLKKLGINVAGRSFAFKKNYRNTKEILDAAYALIKNFDCSGLDEDEKTKPIPPELAKLNGKKPLIVKSYESPKECEYVARRIKRMIDSGVPAGSICVIGLSKIYRERIETKLSHWNIASAEIKDNVNVSNDVVKISTVESAKGHEFSTVFIVGLATPIGREVSNEDFTLEASRLYVAMTRACDDLILTYSVGNGFAASPLLSYVEDFCEFAENR